MTITYYVNGVQHKHTNEVDHNFVEKWHFVALAFGDSEPDAPANADKYTVVRTEDNLEIIAPHELLDDKHFQVSAKVLVPGVSSPALALVWGIQPPPTARVAWGARAIYRLTDEESRTFANGKRRKSPKSITVASIDIVWDRQGSTIASGVPDADTKGLARWLNAKGLPELRKRCAAEYLTSDSEDTIEFEADGFAIKASPQASYGYLYIVAWKVA